MAAFPYVLKAFARRNFVGSCEQLLIGHVMETVPVLNFDYVRRACEALKAKFCGAVIFQQVGYS